MMSGTIHLGAPILNRTLTVSKGIGSCLTLLHSSMSQIVNKIVTNMLLAVIHQPGVATSFVVFHHAILLSNHLFKLLRGTTEQYHFSTEQL